MLLFSAKQTGLTFTEMEEMTMGQVVDYIIQWNNLREPEEKTNKATQSQWDSL